MQKTPGSAACARSRRDRRPEAQRAAATARSVGLLLATDVADYRREGVAVPDAHEVVGALVRRLLEGPRVR